MDVAGLIVGVVVAVVGVSLIADVPRRMFTDPTSQQRLIEASLGGRIALGSLRVRVAYGVVCLVAALLVIVASS
jgi:NhaP-type Na+/H+ or K+/H+ antiporter